MSNYTELFRIGQRVHCILYGGKDGTITAIHGEQSPDSCGTLGGGCIVMGGNCTLDVVWDNGTQSRGLPESLIRSSVQWRVYDDIRDADDVIDAVHHAKNTAALNRERQEATSERRQREREQHRRDNPHLVSKDEQPKYSPGRLAATNIRKELKTAFPGIKFSVRSDYSSVNISWERGPKREDVEAITGKYQAGTFDGMTDCYEYDADKTFADVFGSPRYVFEHRDFPREDLELVAREYCRLRGKPFNGMDSYCGDTGELMWTIARNLLCKTSIPPKQKPTGLEFDGGFRVVVGKEVTSS